MFQKLGGQTISEKLMILIYVTSLNSNPTKQTPHYISPSLVEKLLWTRSEIGQEETLHSTSPLDIWKMKPNNP